MSASGVTMSKADNLIHGPSVLRWVPTTDVHRVAVAERADEIVYCAEEEYEDGLIQVLVCWRPKQLPKQANADVPTYLTPVVSYWKTK